MDALAEILDGAVVPYPQWPARSVVIYGAGHCGREAFRVLQQNGHEVAGFMDAAASPGARIEGLPCLPPGDAGVDAWIRKGLPVLVAVFNFRVDMGLLIGDLRGRGFADVLSYYRFLESFPDWFSEKYWFAPRAHVAAHATELAATLDLWADAESRRIFLEAVRLRRHHDPEALRNPDFQRPYVPGSLPPLPGPVRLIDGGAYDGDTLESMVGLGIPVEAVAAFEPDPHNFSRLGERAARLGLDGAQLFASGLGAVRERARFQCGREAASGFSTGGDGEWLDIRAIDEVLPDFRPSLIKLDIEGFEAAALRGAARTIRTCRPRLAVCVYHRPADLWEIPALLVESVGDGYRHYLRYHGYNGFDLVAYAVP